MKSIVPIKEIEFNFLTTLAVISSDKDLLSIFKDDIGLDINSIITSINNNVPVPKAEKVAKDIFNKIILSKKEYINKYTSQTIGIGSKVNNEIKRTTMSVKVPLSKIKKEKQFPRRYGKVQILNDIQSHGGKGTDLQRALLSINDLKNQYVNMTNKLIKEYLSDRKTLTNPQYREITATVDTVKKKFRAILKIK